MADPATPFSTPGPLALAAQIVAAPVTSNKVPDVLSNLIRGVHDAPVNVAASTPDSTPCLPRRSLRKRFAQQSGQTGRDGQLRARRVPRVSC